MTDKLKMTLKARYRYLEIQYETYRKANRAQKHALLDEMSRVTGMNRNDLIQRMQSAPKLKPHQKQRGRTYDAECDQALHTIWESQNYICAEMLTPMLLSTAQQLAQEGVLCLTAALAQQLARISVSTVRRHLGPIPATQRQRRPDAAPRALQQVIPTHRIPWDIAETGHFELDLVFHCGSHL